MSKKWSSPKGKKVKFNPKYAKPTQRQIDGEPFYSTGTRYKNKHEAKSYAKLMRKMGHRARVIPRKGLFGKKEYVVIRDKY